MHKEQSASLGGMKVNNLQAFFGPYRTNAEGAPARGHTLVDGWKGDAPIQHLDNTCLIHLQLDGGATKAGSARPF